MTAPLTRRRAWTRAGVVFAVVLAADQLSKALVRSNIQPGERHELVPGVHLVRVGNEGLAFGLLGGASTWIVVLAVVVALGGLLVFFARNVGRRAAWLATGLLLGGAAGNIIDRAAHGAVTDWVKLPHWPAFNIADVAITVGVVVLVFAIDAPKDQ